MDSNRFRLKLFLLGLGLGTLATGLILSANFVYAYRNKFYPGVHIDNILVANLTKEEAKNLLISKSERLENYQINVFVDDVSIASSSGELGLKRDYSLALDNAFDFSRDRNFFYKLYSIWQSQKQKPHFNSQFIADEEKIKQMLTVLASKVDTDYDFPTAKLGYSGSSASLQINKGKVGKKLLVAETAAKILDHIKDSNLKIEALTSPMGLELNHEEIDSAQARAKKFVNLFLILKGDDLSQQISDQDLVEFLDLPKGVKETKLTSKLIDLSKNINREPINAVFNFDEKTLIVSEFEASRDGLELNINKTKDQIIDFIKEIDDKNCPEATCANNSPIFIEKEMQVKKTSPQVNLESTNKLGIKELIGFGDSHYAHSIPNRIHNVAHASKLINNTIVAPGEEFSLVKTLGEVSKKTGFKSAYVISDGATVLGDGGGVCQVSTTVFRAALDAGLNITRRLPHSYRVSYYELNSKPGVDATVYTGNVDLRFINDTPNYVLIHNETDSENLYMKVEIYGTSDGRSAEIIDHKTYGYTSPPATEYIPTAELPTGVTKRIENAIPGIKAEFTHVVKDKDGQIISEKKYFSNYRAWGAKYLIGI